MIALHCRWTWRLGGDYETVEELRGMTAQSLCSRSKTSTGFGLMVLASDDLKQRSTIFFKIFKSGVNGNDIKVVTKIC